MTQNETPIPAVPVGQRIYAIGDIHGRLDLLDELLQMVRRDNEMRVPLERHTLIFLGDYIDRGAQSRGVIERLLTGMPDGFERICLKGNHEDFLLRSLSDPDIVPLWMINGGVETLASYGVIRRDQPGIPRRAPYLGPALEKALPPEHLEFFRQLPIMVTFGDYLFVHAGVKPGVPLDGQDDYDCLFIREPFLNARGWLGKMIVHGHTPVGEPEIKSNRIGIDTGGFFSGRLTALRLEGTERGFLAT